MNSNRKGKLELDWTDLQQRHPNLNLDAAHAKAVAMQAPERFSQQRLVQRQRDIVTAYANTFPKLNGQQIADIVRQAQTPDDQQRLTGVFDRLIGSMVKQVRARKRRVSFASTVVGDRQRSGEPGVATSAGNPSTTPVEAAAGSADPASAKRVIVEPLQDARPASSSGAQPAQPDFLSAAPAIKFVGQVYRTGHAEVGTFFDAVKKRAPDGELCRLAKAVEALTAAAAAIGKLHPADRAHYDLALQG